MSFITNQIIKRKKIESINIYIYSYLINCKYFNNLNDDKYMAGTGIMAGICTSHPHPHTQLKKSGIPHTHTHTKSMQGFSVKTGTGSGNTHEDEFICHL